MQQNIIALIVNSPRKVKSFKTIIVNHRAGFIAIFIFGLFRNNRFGA